ncbi:MAG: hypothetical protein ACJ76Z_00935 [Thermoleophilaceae bacterium]
MARNQHIVIRDAGPADQQAIAVLAVVDGDRPRPMGRIVVAEAAGRLRAAVGSNGAAISDPFWPSADLVSMLRVRAGAADEHSIRVPRFALRRPVLA